MPHRPVVVAILGGVAPTVVWSDLPHRQRRGWTANPIGAIEHLDKPPAPDRRRPVAFALHRPPAAAPHRTCESEAAELDDAARGAQAKSHDRYLGRAGQNGRSLPPASGNRASPGNGHLPTSA